MKKIFKEAHRMTNKVDYQAQFGLNLSYLLENEEEKEVKELKGTEKQVKWAEDIRKDQMESYNRFKERWIEKRTAEGNQEELDYIEELTKRVLSIEKAETWIDLKQADIRLHHLLSTKRREETIERMNLYNISL